jgi:hypothetical protein
MKITKQQALDLNNALQYVGDLKGLKFSYAIAKNFQKLRPLMEELQRDYSPSEPYIEFQNEMGILGEKNAESGKNPPEKEVKKLEEKYKNAITVRLKQEIDFKQELKKEVNIDLYLIHIDDIPGGITPKQMSGILLIVDDGKKLDISLPHIN